MPTIYSRLAVFELLFHLTSFAFSFFLFLPFVLCPRLWNRTVDHDDDDEGEHDCPNYPPGQDQQGYYFG